MKYAVFGATGQTGIHVVKQGLDAGHFVTAFVRNPSKLSSVQSDNLTVESVDVFDKETFSSKMEGHDVIFSCLGFPPDRSGVTGYTKATQAIVEGMQANNVKRFVMCHSWYTEEKSRGEAPWYLRWTLIPMIRPILDNMFQVETWLQTESKDIEYTVVRPPGLNNNALSDSEVKTCIDGYHVTGVGMSVPRANVAKFMIEVASKEEYNGKGVAIGI
jgi:biliverdin reductase/flavin reductase